MRVEFDLRESLNALAPGGPIELPTRLSSVRVEFDLRESLNAPDEPIVLPLSSSDVRVVFDLRESLNRGLVVDLNFLNQTETD